MKMHRSFLMVLFVLAGLLVLSGAALAHDVSGTVSYGGSRTGRVYVSLQYNSPYGGSGQVYGVSLVSAGTFTVRGVPDGDYTLKAYMDVVGNRERHPADPSGSTNVQVAGGNLSGANVTLADPAPADPASPSSLSGMPGDGSIFLMWRSQRDQNNVHLAETFDLFWSTDPAFLASWPTVSAEGSVTGIKASENDNIYFHTGIVNNTTYYYVMTGTTGVLVSTTTATAIMAPAAPVGGYNVSGTITASGFDPSGSTLFVVLYSDSLGVYYSVINDPASSQSYTVAGVPDGMFSLYPIYDMNGNGLIDAGDVSPGDSLPSSVTVSGSDKSGVDATLTAAAGSAMAGTSHWQRDNGCSEGYSINLRAEDGVKNITNVALTSAPTNSFVLNGPIDLALNEWGEFTYWTESVRPTIGDSFEFAVEYADGTTDTLTADITAVLDDFPVPTAPLGVIANEPTPTFSWSLSATPSYPYSYQLWLNGQNTMWDAWDMPSTQLSAVYASIGEANPSTLSGNASYGWTISLRDDDGNEAQSQTSFAMGGGISGTVTDSSLAGIGCVQVEVTLESDPMPIGWATTNPDGTYAVGLGTGTYKVRFSGGMTGYSDEYYNDQTDWMSAHTVSVTAGSVTPGIDAVLGGSGAISGRVTNDSAVGIQNVEVYVCQYVGPTMSDCTWGFSSAYTDEAGYYTLGGLPSGQYIVGFYDNASATEEYYDNSPNQDGATLVSVSAGDTTTGINAVLSSSAAPAQAKIGVFRGSGWWYLDTNDSRAWDAGDSKVKFGIAGDIPVTGDWNGDGVTDIGVFRPTNAYWYLDMNDNRILDAGDSTFRFGIAGDIPVTGDWNGDGTTDVGVFRGSADWYLDLNGSRTWNTGDAKVRFGIAGDIPVTGDWNGDGTTEIGVYRAGDWYIDLNNSRSWNTGDLKFRFGIAGDLPVTGDWNADGVTDVSVFRGNGDWYIDLNGSRSWNAGDVKRWFGITGDKPVAGSWGGGGAPI